MSDRVRGIGHFPAQYAEPLTGASVAMTRSHLTVKPAGTIAALTILVPDDPYDGEEVSFNTTQTITALTVDDTAGATFANAPTTLSAGAFARMKYREADNTWYRIG